jgi:hypothetical protein
MNESFGPFDAACAEYSASGDATKASAKSTPNDLRDLDMDMPFILEVVVDLNINP